MISKSIQYVIFCWLLHSSVSKSVEKGFSDREACTTKGQCQEKVQRRLDTIIKSPKDSRDFRGLILKNEMKVLLISDPTTDKSAASMNVAVGSMSDPPEIQGLAHFCEQMLFMGTTKYPQENDYKMYISQNGGSSNAMTGLDFTNYIFDLNADNLEGALDRFSQFFLAPLFTESSTEREKKAVNSEHERNLASDSWRSQQVEKLSANQKHPYSGFSTGNIKTLEIIPKQKNIDVRQELLNFHKKWYSANIMSLSVLGKESLDDLEKMVIKMFANVTNKNIEPPEWTEHPFNEEQFQCKWYIVPVTNLRTLIITFPLPDLRKYFRTFPETYLTQIFGNKGEGSLYSVIQAKGWSTSLTAIANSEVARGFGFFHLELQLTEKGLNHVDDIITLIFQYINMLRKEGPKEWIFNEYADFKNISFRFMEKQSLIDYMQSVSKNLQKYPIEEVLSAPYSLTEWNPDLINSIIGHLTPENIRVQVLARIYENITTQVEPWFQTKFKKERIPANVIEKWSNAGLNSDFKLPEKNEFIPTKFDLKLDNHDIEKFPVIIKDTPIMRVWFKQDNEFLFPKANLYFKFFSPLAYLDPLSYINVAMFAKLVEDSLLKYSTNSVGLFSNLAIDQYGINLSINGYDDKQLVLLEKIMDKMMNFGIDEARFESLKESYIRDLKDFETQKPFNIVAQSLVALIAETFWRNDNLLNACAGLTFESVRNFVSQMFTNMQVECLIYGNFRKNEALNISSLVDSKLRSPNNFIKGNITPLLPSELALHRAVSLDAGRHFLYEIKDKIHKSSCSLVYYQNSLNSTKSTMLLKLFAEIISEPVYTVLRAQEQLGYIVNSNEALVNKAQGLYVGVQSERHPQYVEERIDKVMESMKERIKNMSDDEFRKHKKSLAGKLSEKPKNMETLANTFWSEILSKEYNFDRANEQVKILKTITKEDIILFYKVVVDNSSQNRKKLSIHSISMAEGGSGLSNETGATIKSKEEQPTRIEDIDSFKASQSLYPVLQQFVNASQYLHEKNEVLKYHVTFDTILIDTTDSFLKYITFFFKGLLHFVYRN